MGHTPFGRCNYKFGTFKDAVQSVCKQRLCSHFGIQNIEFYSTTIYIFMILEYNKLSRHNNQALQEHKNLNKLFVNKKRAPLCTCADRTVPHL
jgi:hypothetical protein